jgi:ABC-type uncharacterized transport system ATPase subunit
MYTLQHENVHTCWYTYHARLHKKKNSYIRTIMHTHIQTHITSIQNIKLTLSSSSSTTTTTTTQGADPHRCAMLMDVLEIEPTWRICRISDGQRRRVQLLLGLARASKLLLLDEVTTDLDLVGRQNLLQVRY